MHLNWHILELEQEEWLKEEEELGNQQRQPTACEQNNHKLWKSTQRQRKADTAKKKKNGWKRNPETTIVCADCF